MKIKYALPIMLLGWHVHAFATADLIAVYKQAQISDPLFQQAVAQRLSTKEGVPISVATLLPNIDLQTNPFVTRSSYSGTQFSSNTPRNITSRGYNLTLSATQTIFDFAEFSTVAQQLSLSKAADATLNAALQDLMIRVSNAYFAVLRDEDNLNYASATKRAYKQQYDQIQEQYKVGIKTITDVYTAQASYDSAIATFIAAETTLANDKENLRVLTGVYYPTLKPLSDRFPLITPKPANVEIWVQKALCQNWSIKSALYQTNAARQVIKQQFAGHLPTVDLEASVNRQFTNNVSPSSSSFSGPGTITNRTLGVNIDFPIFSGGGVVAKTNQATYDFRVAQQQQEEIQRNVVNATRQNYLNVVAGISQIKADKEAIKSSQSSLSGLEESYKVGTETLVDVLNQQENVFEAQTKYATDRYAYIANLLSLKQAAGTLSFKDLCAINEWLVDNKKS